MFSRRTFLLAGLALIWQPPGTVWAKKRSPAAAQLGPHTLAREEWPPAIAADFVSVVDKGYALLADQSGRLAIVDFKRESGPQVIGELFGIAHKIVDLVATSRRAYALVSDETNSEQPFAVLVIDLTQPGQPQVTTRVPVSYLSEVTALAANQDVVAVAGTGSNGQNQVLLLNVGSRRRSDEGNGPLATINVAQPVSAMNFEQRQLVIVQAGTNSTDVAVYNMGNVRAPQKLPPLQLHGSLSKIVRLKDALVLAGTGGAGPSERKPQLDVVALRPAPHLVSTDKLPMRELIDLAGERDEVLVLGTQGSRLAVLPIHVSKGNIVEGNAVVLPADVKGITARARLAVHDKQAYIASDAGSVLILSISNTGWQYLFSHTIPRLPVASVAVAGNHAVLAGGDIKVYDISAPQHPQLVGEVQPGVVVRSVAVAGNYFLALTKDSLTLRKLDPPADVVASVKVDGQKLAYDQAQHRAYVIAARGKETVVTPVRVSGSLASEAPFTLPSSFQHIAAENGRLLLSGLSNISLYDATGKQLGARAFPNFAIRDLALLGETAVLTAVDAGSKGFLLTINIANGDLPTIGSVDLPQDAVALAVEGSQAVVVGRNVGGKDEASIISLANAAAPKVLSTFPVLEAASAVAIEGKLALVGGRGLQVLSL